MTIGDALGSSLKRSETLIKCLRKEFEEHRNMDDSVEIGRKLVLGKQSLIELDGKLLKLKGDINKFVSETRTDQKN